MNLCLRMKYVHSHAGGGIIPGETNWASISAFLASFAEVSKHSPSSPKGYAAYIPLSNQYPKDLLWLSVYLNENSTVKYINGRRYYHAN